MNRPKRHHYIPVMLLKHFTDDNGQVHCCRWKTTRPHQYWSATPHNTLLENNLYTQYDKSGTPDMSIELGLSKIESEVSQVIDKIVDLSLRGHLPGLSAEEKQHLIRFIFCQCKRMPENRDLINEKVTRWLKEIPRAFEREVGRAVTPDELAQIETQEYQERMRHNAFSTFVGTPLADSTLKLVANCTFSYGVIRRQKKSFVIGVWDNMSDWLPVHQRVAIRFGHPNQHPRRGLFEFTDTAEVRRINEGIARNSSTFGGASERLVRSLSGRQRKVGNRGLAERQ